MKQIKFSEEKLKVLIDTYVKVVDEIENDEVKKGFHRLMDAIGERLFECPASPKLHYHNCCVGGLVEHSLRVLTNLRKLSKEFAPNLSDDSMTLVALAHDLGKLGTPEEPYYIPQDNDWRKDNLGEMYTYNDNLDYLGVAHRSLRLLQNFGIPTTEEEHKAILIHDGQYVEENRPYRQKEGWLALLLHQADMIACTFEAEKWKAIQ